MSANSQKKELKRSGFGMSQIIMFEFTNGNDIIREFEVDGERKYFDFCSTLDLETAKEYHKGFAPYHVGSSNILYLNGVRNEYKKIHHFFNKQPLFIIEEYKRVIESFKEIPTFS